MTREELQDRLDAMEWPDLHTIDTADLDARWLEAYSDWLVEGVIHRHEGDRDRYGHEYGDPTQYRIAYERPDNKDGWKDFLGDLSSESKATFVSGWGLEWQPYAWLMDAEYNERLSNTLYAWLRKELGYEGDVDDDDIRHCMLDNIEDHISGYKPYLSAKADEMLAAYRKRAA